MFGISTQELLILAAILLLLFGASRLPSLMRNMGRSVNEFKHGLRDQPKDHEALEEKDSNEESAEQAAS
jgi:sec-independent protein translocase protein TatA